jgi:hypothetical protein
VGGGGVRGPSCSLGGRGLSQGQLTGRSSREESPRSPDDNCAELLAFIENNVTASAGVSEYCRVFRGL